MVAHELWEGDAYEWGAFMWVGKGAGRFQVVVSCL